MEWVDLYDENRIPLGKTAERYARKQNGEYRVVVHVCIFDSQGRLLTQQRSLEKRMCPGKWDVSAAGAVDAGETVRESAERETLEELGCSLDLKGYRPSFTVNFPGGFDDFFIVQRDVELSELTLQTEEVSAVCWRTKEEILEMMERGEFVSYPDGFIPFLFTMRNQFGFVIA